MKIAVAADERVGVAEAVVAELREAGPRGDPRTAPSATRSATTGPGRARRRRATSPRGAPSRRSSAAGPAPAPRSPPTRSPGIRAALCGDAATAEGARRWNDANVLALSLRATSEAELGEILDAWLERRAQRRAPTTWPTSRTWTRSSGLRSPRPARPAPRAGRDHGRRAARPATGRSRTPPADRPYVASNFVTTLDGRAAIGGRSGPIGSDTDTEMLLSAAHPVRAP